MSARRAFYVVQGGLRVCEVKGGDFEESRAFADSDEGVRDFDRYLQSTSGRESLIVVDVIEEMFATDSIPKLGFRDQKALLDRRAQRKYPRSPYRLPVVARGQRGDEREVILSSISNHELLDPWIRVMLRHQTPVSGIYSVPLMAPELLSRLYPSLTTVLFVTQHQGTRLRQVFVQNGVAKSARLSQAPRFDDAAYAQSVLNEIQRSRRYLERTRLLSPMEQLDVCMIAEASVAESLMSGAESDSPMQLHFVQPQSAARKLAAGGAIEADHLEGLYISRALRSRPRHSYARSGENRFWQMSRLRRGIIAGSAVAAAVCSMVAGLWLGEALKLHRESAFVEAQVTQLSETFRRENEHFGPIKADSHAMKLAVDTGDFILQQRVPVPWVMQQLGTVLSQYPDVHVRALSWQAETDTLPNQARQRPGEAPLPVPIPEIRSVSVSLTGSLEPFDGNMRRAFERIDALVGDIASETSFSEARAVEYPLDANIRSAVTGEINRDQVAEAAVFRLSLNYPLSASPDDEVDNGDL